MIEFKIPELGENVAGGDRIIKLHCIEKSRLATEKHDIAEMQVPMAAPHETTPAANAIARPAGPSSIMVLAFSFC